MNIVSKIIIGTLSVVMLVGCGTKGGTQATSGPSEKVTGVEFKEPAKDSGGAIGGAETFAAPSDSGFSGATLDDPSSLLSKRVIYFDYDKSNIKQEFRDIIAAHAAYLGEHPSASIILEGHADERGTREYNIGLGERRANSVSRFLALQGASSGQMETISYGEERPVAFGHDESSWRLNRRVEIIYQGR